jgi:2-keto-4-pentenoate hydratase
MLNKVLAISIAQKTVAKLPGDDIADQIPDFDTAYALQDEVASILQKNYGGIAGYKIAWNNAVQIAELSPNAPAVGHIFCDQVQNAGVRFPAGSFGQLVVEPEIIAVIGQDILGPEQTPETVLPFIAEFHAGFEIMDRRGSSQALQAHPPSIVANNIFNNGLVIGEHHEANVDFSTIETVVHWDGKEILRATNAAPQNPALAVATVANILAKRGKYLRAGDKVLCGTHMPPFVVEKGTLSVTMGVLGGADFSYG